MASDSFGIKNIQIKLSENEYNALDDKARSARMKITPFARELFLSAIEKQEGNNKEDTSVAGRRWCKVLDFILKHGSKDHREWITGNLKTFAEAIEARAPKSQDFRKHA